MNLNFDATKYDPTQGNFTKHPIGKKFQAVVSEVSTKENNNKDGGYFEVIFTTPAGQIANRYNLFFTNPNDGQKKSQEIAQKQLSALCHATGIFRLGDGRELLNARLLIDVDWQKGQEPTPEKPEGGYTQISKVYDASGNEPGKAPAPAQAAAPNAGWSGTPQSPAPALAVQGWSNSPPAPNNAPAPAAAAPTQQWTQGPSAPAGAPPPWASR